MDGKVGGERAEIVHRVNKHMGGWMDGEGGRNNAQGSQTHGSRGEREEEVGRLHMSWFVARSK